MAEARAVQACALLRSWDGEMLPDRAGAAIFTVFFAHWTKAVVRERFAEDVAGLVAGGAGGLAAALLQGDDAGWFRPGRRESALIGAFEEAVQVLSARLGSDPAAWNWGRLHLLRLCHPLSGRGELGALLDQPGMPVRGDMHTVCNTGLGAAFDARSGAGYRLIADLSASPPVLQAIDGQSQSGHPGSPHYGDQVADWLAGRYHTLSLDRTDRPDPQRTTILQPRETP
jgi:penicillin amidase